MVAVVEQEVARFHVAMDDPGLVRRVECGRGFVEPVEHLPGLESPLAIDALVQRAAREVLHDDDRPSVVLPDVEDRDDVVVPGEPRRRECFPLEPLAEAFVLGIAFGKHLDRHLAAEHLVSGQEDLAHPAVGDEPSVPVAGR